MDLSMRESVLALVAALGVVMAAGASVLELRVGASDADGWKAAKAKLVEAKRAGLRPGTVEIVLGAGEHRATDGWTVDGTMCGEANPLVIRAERPGATRVVGGRTLTADRFSPVTDPAVRARLPESARDAVRVCDISPECPGKVPVWPNNIADTPPGPWLYLGERMLPIARWPDEAADHGGEWMTATFRETRRDRLEFDHPRMDRWNFECGVWAMGYWQVDWADEYIRLKSRESVADAQTAKVLKLASLSNIIATRPGIRRKFYFLNLLEELDRPGEWWVDRVAKKLYWYPVPGSGDPMLAVLDRPILSFSGASQVTVKDITFACVHAARAAVTFDDSADCAVVGCRFVGQRETGVEIGDTARRCTVESCVFAGIGGMAVNIKGGDRKQLVSGGNAVKNCRMRDFCRLKRTYRPGVRIEGCGNALVGNDIADSPFIAIWYHGNEHLIASNHIHHVVRISEDSGAIYSGRDTASFGSVVFGNEIEDVGETPVAEKNGLIHMGIYFDDCDWGDWVVGNRFAGTGPAMFIGGGNLFHVYNNVAEGCRIGFHMDGRGITWPGLRGSFSNNAKTGRSYFWEQLKDYQYTEVPWSVAYPGIARVIDDEPQMPKSNIISNNVLAGCVSPWSLFWAVQPFTNAFVRLNRVVATNGHERVEPPQPIRLADASETNLVSPDGRLAAWFGLDVAGRFSWTLKSEGERILDVSPLGFTVDETDFGHPIVPGAGVTGADGITVIPLRSLVTGEKIAAFEIDLKTGTEIAWRWRIPGTGRRRAVGEFSAWVSDRATRFDLADRDAPAGWPKLFVWERAPRVTGVSYPLKPHGWPVEGEVVTPWRVTKVLPDVYLTCEGLPANVIRAYCRGKRGKVRTKARSCRFGPDRKPVWQDRLDAVVVDEKGEFRMVFGHPADANPVLPDLKPGEKLVGTVFVDKTVERRITDRNLSAKEDQQ